MSLDDELSGLDERTRRKETAHDAKESARGVGDIDGGRLAGIPECKFAGSAKCAATASRSGDTGRKARSAGQSRDTRRAGKTAHRVADDVSAGREVAKFSINARPEEADLSRADAEEIQKLLGTNAIVPIAQSGNLRDVLQSHWPQPVELFFWLMVLVLFVLALECLLANRFYRQPRLEAETGAAGHVSVPATQGKREAAASATGL